MSSITYAYHLSLIVALVSLQNMSFCRSCCHYSVVSVVFKEVSVFLGFSWKFIQVQYLERGLNNLNNTGTFMTCC